MSAMGTAATVDEERVTLLPASSVLDSSEPASAPASPVSTSPPASLAPIFLVPIPAAEPDPGGFATFAYQVENRSEDSLAFGLLLETPGDWQPLSRWRDVHLLSGEARTIPFTVWVPATASSDTAHTLRLSALLSGANVEITSVSRSLSVARRAGMSISAGSIELAAPAGAKVVVRFLVSNTGNARDTYDLETSALPEWNFELKQRRVSLNPGESLEIPVTLNIPAAAGAGTTHLFTLAARGQSDGFPGEEPSSDRCQVRTRVLAGSVHESRFPRLPLEAVVSLGELSRGNRTGGIRAATRGTVGARTDVDVELDLVSGDRAVGVQGWRSQRLHLGLSRGAWELGLGDVSRVFPDLATHPLSGRGLVASTTGETWRARFFGGRNQTRAESYSWAAGLERTVHPGLRLGGDFLSLQEDGDHANGATSLRETRLACAGGELLNVAGRGWLRMETGWSKSRDGETVATGTGAQLSLDHQGARVLARGRAYTGSAGFGGRTQDRDGVLSYLRYSPVRPVRVWANLETSQGSLYRAGQSPWQRTTRYRLGSTYARPRWPTVELTAGGLKDQEVSAATSRKLSRADASAGATYALGPILAAATGRWGHARNVLTNRQGGGAAYEATLGGSLLGVKAIAHWTRESEWLPEVQSRASVTGFSGEMSWSPRRGTLQVGFGGSTRLSDSSPVLPAQRDSRLRPWIEIPLPSHLRLSVHASVLQAGGRSRMDGWQAQVSYSARELLPLLWSPVRGGAVGVVFVDEDQDGEPDPGEKRVSGVLVRVEGGQRATDTQGRFEWRSLEPGTYWLELDLSTLPLGLTPREALPLEIRVEAGKTSPILVPLAATSQMQGQIFLDENRDGSLSPGETGLEEIRVLVTRDGETLRDCLTDKDGRYQVSELPPGRYEVRIADGWLASDWSVTTGPASSLRVEPGRTLRVAPFGVAPQPRPILRTYPRDDNPR